MNAATSSSALYLFHFGLIVTGEGEEQHLPKLFRSLATTGVCTFKVITRIGQRNPITSPSKTARMVGSGKIIPNKDAEKIGLPARRFLNSGASYCVIVIDDLEYDRREIARDVFIRYRAALDAFLTFEQRSRAAVHFLVYMLEAYYFADANAINTILHLDLEDYAGDVETIHHPKGELKRLYGGFDEVEHGGQILEHLNVEHVLSCPDTCASLRTMFAWCAQILSVSPFCDYSTLAEKFHFQQGRLSDVTAGQLTRAQA